MTRRLRRLRRRSWRCALVRVLACTDEPVLAAGLSVALARRPGLTLAGACPSVEALDSMIGETRPDVVLLQVNGQVTLDALRRLTASDASYKIVLWARDVPLPLAAHGLNLGVAGVLRTTLPLEMAAKCIERVAAGERWFERDLLENLLSARTVELTRREGQLVRLLAQGLNNREIAEALSIKETTVKVYLSKLYAKTGCKDRLALALHGLRNEGSAVSAAPPGAISGDLQEMVFVGSESGTRPTQLRGEE